jgi:hypothetical protein
MRYSICQRNESTSSTVGASHDRGLRWFDRGHGPLLQNTLNLTVLTISTGGVW